MDLSNFSIPQLQDLLRQIPVEIKRREKSEKANLLKEIKKLVTARGFSLSEIMSDGTEKTTKSPVAPKFRSLSDSTLTWTGRGRQPKWVQEYLAQGGKIEELAI